MCLSKLYVVKNGEKELLMEEVAAIEVGDNRLLFSTLFGEQKELVADLKQIDFMTHSIVLENLREPG
ncbi:CooT family nickel-binding protein [Chloroflexota bacterium]